jgi:hypothetical protein
MCVFCGDLRGSCEMTLDFFKKEPKISPILYHFQVIFDSLAKKFRNLAFLTPSFRV